MEFIRTLFAWYQMRDGSFKILVNCTGNLKVKEDVRGKDSSDIFAFVPTVVDILHILSVIICTHCSVENHPTEKQFHYIRHANFCLQELRYKLRNWKLCVYIAMKGIDNYVRI